MIPKIIHYCWFGRGPLPPLVKWCMKSWKKKLPDYTIKLWNEDNFDVNSIPFVKEAYEARKFAYVADYVRLYALYHEGGIYLDSDERVLRPLDEFLKYNFVVAHEFHPGLFKPDREKINADGTSKVPGTFIEGLGISGVLILSCPQHPYIKDCMEFYHTHHFVNQKGEALHNQLIIGWILSTTAEKYGYRYTTYELDLGNGFIVKDKYTFVSNSLFLNNNSFVIHLGMGSWHDKSQESFKRKLYAKYPQLGYGDMLLRNKLRKIKWLFISKSEKKDRMGDWFAPLL